jgi:hypothetical protein
VAVAQKDETVPIWLKRVIGGCYRIINKIQGTYHEWSVGGWLAAAILEKISPYLLSKKEQSELAIEFQKLVVPSAHHTQNIFLAKITIYNKLRALHSAKGRGVKEIVVTPVESESSLNQEASGFIQR